MSKTDLKKIKNAIEATTSKLKWDIEIINDSNIRLFEIRSSYHNKHHQIKFPLPNYDKLSYHIDILHELFHATLAEKVHVQFATISFDYGTSGTIQDAVGDYLKAAQEWFVDEYIYKLLPDIFSGFYSLRYNDMVNNLYNEKYKYIKEYGYPLISLVFARAIRSISNNIIVDNKFKETVNAFLSVNPSKPSVENLELLICKLLAVHTPYKAKLIYNEEIKSDLFKIYL